MPHQKIQKLDFRNLGDFLDYLPERENLLVATHSFFERKEIDDNLIRYYLSEAVEIDNSLLKIR
ncbi:MAG: hypothetical protein KDC53_23500 [Saprospiraceae bacterium]|nr:hypothetical protein [Saprospiraceae bacterium]